MPYKNVNDPVIKERLRLSRRKYYHSHKESEKLRNVNKRESIKAYIRDVKSVPCTDCGVSYPYYVMDFDHLRDKAFTISKLANQKNLQKVKDEIAKCDVVCSNCHRERTHKRYQDKVLR